MKCTAGRDALIALVLAAGLCAGRAADAQQACDRSLSSLPAQRFQDNGDGTVTDAASNLMWMRCALGQQWTGGHCTGSAERYAWSDAQRQADRLSQQGSAFFNDWRVPALRELATITDRGCSDPRTNLEVFPDTPAAPFWSSTPRPGEGPVARALGLSFGAEGVVLSRMDERLHVRLVRTGP
jgi:hypothetical protein